MDISTFLCFWVGGKGVEGRREGGGVGEEEQGWRGEAEKGWRRGGGRVGERIGREGRSGPEGVCRGRVRGGKFVFPLCKRVNEIVRCSLESPGALFYPPLA